MSSAALAVEAPVEKSIEVLYCEIQRIDNRLACVEKQIDDFEHRGEYRNDWDILALDRLQKEFQELYKRYYELCDEIRARGGE